MFRQRLRLVPQPWALLIAADECWAGNNLAESGRKMQILSFSFLELGARHLSKMVAWFAPLVVESVVQKRVEGQFSRIAAEFLEHVMFN